jgi:hypothetical protein
MNRIKVSEGDCLVCTIAAPGGVTQEYLNNVNKRIYDWMMKRGLKDVETVFCGGVGTEIKLTMQLLSVNDIFEQEVLK